MCTRYSAWGLFGCEFGGKWSKKVRVCAHARVCVRVHAEDDLKQLILEAFLGASIFDKAVFCGGETLGM